ncbi:major facilitator superfamily transporter [Thozetella sp. PMI_491]|nr:major facilitator superfamily transporter [Thozetella sp. PMI_491]
MEENKALPVAAEAVLQSDLEASTHSHPSERPDLEKLGRRRPAVFRNAWVEIGFCVGVLGSMVACEFLVSGFNVLLPIIINDLDIDPSNRTWPSSILTLIVGSFLLPFGRLADMYGGYIIYMVGLVWMLIWSLIGGFARTYAMVLATRALQGLGAAAVLTAGMNLLGNTYRPGPRKNVVFSLYGGCAPAGFFTGIFFAGLSGQFFYWGWYFWIDSIIIAIITAVSLLCVPRDKPTSESTMDWLGCVLVIPGLTMVTYAITDSAHVNGGWKAPQILAPFVVGIVFLGAFVYYEGWVAKDPLIPPTMLAPKHTKSLFLCLFLSYGLFGIYLFYASFYIETVLGIKPLLAAAWFVPMIVGGILIGFLGGFVLHRLSGTALLLLSTCSFLVSVSLFAFMPENPNYWAWVFPAMICTTLGIDVMFNTSTVFITTSIPKAHQGVAGAFINVLVFSSMSFFLGLADTAVASKADLGLQQAFKVAFYFAMGLGGLSILLVVFRVRIGKAVSDLTFDEKAERTARSTPK